ncbi:MAG: hypothetical protein HYX69_01180 [Planctomycetia bacterium]|nr:hypothetical protein [Planctomycetia bacterium]
MAGRPFHNVGDEATPDRSRTSRTLRGVWQLAERMADQAPLRFSLLAVIPLMALVVLVFRPCYATNDDVFLTMIVAGKGFCPAPDEHMVFTNIVVGQVLKRLYAAVPAIPWYGCYLVAIHYLAQVVILYGAVVVDRTWAVESGDRTGSTRVPLATGLSRRRLTSLSPGQVRLRCGLYLLYFALVELPLVNALQFTTTAFLASQAGIFLLLVACRRGTQQPDANVTRLVSGSAALLFLGAMVRLEALVMAILVAVPIAMVLARGIPRRLFVACGAATAAASIMIVAVTAYDRWCYERDPHWAGFRSYNQLRGKFHDDCWTAYTPETAAIFSRVGWSENDHAMIASWFSDDPELFNEANLRSIVEAYPWKSARLTSQFWSQAWREIGRNRSVVAVFLALPFVLAAAGAGWSGRRGIAVSMVTAVGLVAYLAWNKKIPPERVYFPLLSFPLSLLLLSSAWRPSWWQPRGAPLPADGFSKTDRAAPIWQPRQLAAWATVGLLAVGVAIGVHRQSLRSVRVNRARGELQAFLAELRPSGHEVYVCWAWTMPFELLSPWDNLQWCARMPLLTLVWTQGTPCQEDLKRQFGITRLAPAMYERDDVLLVATPKQQSSFVTFAKEHFGADVEFVPSKQVGARLVAGRFRRCPGATAGQTEGSRLR